MVIRIIFKVLLNLFDMMVLGFRYWFGRFLSRLRAECSVYVMDFHILKRYYPRMYSLLDKLILLLAYYIGYGVTLTILYHYK